MGETQLPAIRPELYERLIDRLGLALETARTSVRLRDEMPAELELRGLSHAEFEVIKAYLESLPERHNAPVGSYPQAEPDIGQDHLAQGQETPRQYGEIQDAATSLAVQDARRRLSRAGSSLSHNSRSTPVRTC